MLTDAVYRRLRLALMRAELLPHQRLKIRELARAMSTSETPVREAVLQLAREGAVEVKPRLLIRVRRLSLADYLDIRDVRLELEPLAAERAMSNIGPGDLEKLDALHDALIAAERGEDWRGALEANRAFHFAIFERAGMPALVHVLEGLWVRVGPMLSELYPAARPYYPDGHQHIAILQALRRRDAYALRMAVRLDLVEGGRNLVNRLARQEGRPPSWPLPSEASKNAIATA